MTGRLRMLLWQEGILLICSHTCMEYKYILASNYVGALKNVFISTCTYAYTYICIYPLYPVTSVHLSKIYAVKSSTIMNSW